MKIEMFPLKKARARRTDPYVSHVAASQVEESRAISGQRLNIYIALCKGKGTPSEVGERIGMTKEKVSKRMREIPHIRLTGVIRKNKDGYLENEWEAIVPTEKL
jgi:hypothetical protein